jgi:LuxR family quorum-sensing system transcriptional regulator CciR
VAQWLHEAIFQGLSVNRLAQVQRFVRSVREANSLADIRHVLSEATREFEFDYFALVQRISARPAIGPVQLSDYPSEWVDLLAATAYHVHDPVLVACEKSVTPFAWDAIPDMISMSKHQIAYMANARSAGLDRGFTVPIHVPGSASGLCSFVTTKGRQLPAESLPAAQYLACFAFEAARRLVGNGDGGGGDGGGTGKNVTDIAPKLTQRQLDCVVLAARGKSNWVAGQLLGVSPDTVHKYLESAKRRYGVSSRTELVVRALFDGQLSFNDVMIDDFALPGQKRARPGQRLG